MNEPSRSREPGGRLAITALAAIGALATLAYWVIWFGVNREWLAAAHTDAYYTFENAFPLADAWMAVTLALAAVTVWRRHASAMLWLLVGGSAAIYLGCMDVLFDLQNHIYGSPDVGAVAVELAINAFCLAGGVTAIAYGWRLRGHALPRSADGSLSSVATASNAA